MSKPIPIYRNHDGVFEADTCLPLVGAAAQGKIRLEALIHGHYPGQKLPAHVLPGLKTVGYWDTETEQDWGLDWHRNEGLEITFLESGKIEFALEDHAYTLRPADLTVTRPWQLHRVGAPRIGAGRLHWIIIDVGVRRPNQGWRWPAWLMLSEPELDELANILRHNEQPVWKGGTEVRNCFAAIAHAVESDERGSSISRLTVKINELFLLLLELFRRHRVPLDHSLSSSRRTVELFLADLKAHREHLAVNWTVDEMARACGLGVTQFIYHVRSLTNMTPMHYLNQCRLELSSSLLRENPAASITDIALECGFSSSQYFATLFSRRFGRPPRLYR